MDNREICIESKEIYKGKVITVKVDKVKLPNGQESYREEVIHRGGAGILVVKKGKILLERQYRYAYDETVFEIPAGKIENGENPITTAKREIEEEAGLKAKGIKYITTVYPTVGYSNEKIYLFFAEEFEESKIHLDEDEFLTCEWCSLEDAINMVKNGEIKDSKTIIAILWYENFLKKNK